MGCLNSRYRREWDRGGMAGLTLTSLIQLLIQYWKKREIEKRDKARQGRTRQPMESRGKSDVASGVVWGHTSTSTYHAPTHPPTNTHRGIKKCPPQAPAPLHGPGCIDFRVQVRSMQREARLGGEWTRFILAGWMTTLAIPRCLPT